MPLLSTAERTWMGYHRGATIVLISALWSTCGSSAWASPINRAAPAQDVGQGDASSEVPSSEELKAILQRVMAEDRFRNEADARRKPEDKASSAPADKRDAKSGDRTVRRARSPSGDGQDRGDAKNRRPPNTRRWGRGAFGGDEPGSRRRWDSGWKLPSLSISGAGWTVGFAWLVGALLVLVVLVGLLFVVYQVWLNRLPRAVRVLAASAPAMAPEQTVSALDKDVPSWFAEADALAIEGRYREAVRAIYLALLAHLHRLRLIDYRRGKTNWENIRGYNGPALAGERLRGLTRAFDFVWYGGTLREQPQFAEVRAWVEEMVHGLKEV